MTEKADEASSEKKDASVLRERRKDKDIEYWLKSKLTAGFVGAILLALIAVIRDFSQIHEYATVAASVLGFLAGAYLGERAVFAIVGALVAYLFMDNDCA